jgi:hypothetical protein
MQVAMQFNNLSSYAWYRPDLKGSDMMYLV